MMYIVGLGNPGEQYAKQRHNVGWLVADRLLEKFNLPTPVPASRYSGRLSEGVVHGTEVAVLYPDTFMNNSGTAVRKLVPAGAEANLILIYDDVDIPLGAFKLSVGRGDGGHNGVKSVIAALGTKDFIRVRVGIAQKGWFGGVKRPARAKLPKHVLGNFTASELATVNTVAEQLTDVIALIIAEGITKAMNEYN